MLKVKGLILAAAFVVASALPTAAQDLGLGVSFLGDEGGTGFIIDYSAPLNKTAGDFALNWVGDLSFHHKGYDAGIFGDYSRNILLAQGGLRIGGKVNDNVSWHAQGLVGIIRASYGGDFDAVCDLPGADCGSTDVVFTPGGAIAYHLNEKSAVRAQLDLPISDGNTTRFSLMYVMRMGN